MSEFGLDIKKILEENKQEIVTSAIQQIKSSIASSISYGSNREINEAIAAFVKAEIIPEVDKYLLENRDTIVEAYMEVIAESMGMIGKTMLATATKNLASEYNAKQIAKQIFNW